MKLNQGRRLWAMAVGAAMLAPGAGHAAGGAGSKFLGGDFSYNGFFRWDVAFSTDDRVS